METEQREEGFEKVVLEKLEWLTQEVGKLNLEERLSLSVEDKRFYSTKEAAGLVGRSAWTVRQFCNRREVKGAHKVAGRGQHDEWRISREGVEELRQRLHSPLGHSEAA